MGEVWTEEQARRELEAWRASGQSIERYAKEQRVAGHRLRYWKERLSPRAAATKGKAVSFLPVRITQAIGSPVEIVLCSGHVARVGRGFDEETLARVIAVIGRR